jgi:hypothetical protein
VIAVRHQGAVAVGRLADVAKRFRPGEAAPRFLLFLKSRLKGRSLELPAKTSSTTEVAFLLLMGFAILVMLAVAIRACHQR